MKEMKLGRVRNRKPENRYKRGSTTKYVKKPIVTKNCTNPDCINTFEDTPDGKQKFCSPECLRKVNGRVPKNPRKKNENL